MSDLYSKGDAMILEPEVSGSIKTHAMIEGEGWEIDIDAYVDYVVTERREFDPPEGNEIIVSQVYLCDYDRMLADQGHIASEIRAAIKRSAENGELSHQIMDDASRQRHNLQILKVEQGGLYDLHYR